MHKKQSWYSLQNAAGEGAATLYIHDEIGGWGVTAMDLIKELMAIGERELILRVQSYGGSVYEGLALYNALKAHKGKTTAVVDGIAASIASYIILGCDEIHMPENAILMIHNPSIWASGEEKELESALSQLKNAKKTIADAYCEKSGKSAAEVSAAMDKETWLTANEALEFGLIDRVIEAVELTNHAVAAERLSNFKNVPELVNSLIKPTAKPQAKEQPPEQLPEQPPEQPLEQQSEQEPNNMPQALQAALKKENERQAAIRALCATHKIQGALVDEMLNDLTCDELKASQKILSYLGSQSALGAHQPTNVTPTHMHVGNGNITKDALQNALNARIGVAEVEKDNPYKLKTLFDMAEIALGKEACKAQTKSDLVARAFNTGDYGAILTESVRTVMRDESKVRAPRWKELANTENLPDFRETQMVMVNDAPDLLKINEEGEYKSAVITGTGEKLQLASFGREISFTRQAIINDEIALISRVPRKMMQAAYRLSDKLFFNALLNGVMSDGNGVFVKGSGNQWGNLHDIAPSDYQALVMALHKSFATATTAEGDALDLVGKFILASPEHASTLEAVLNTASKPDSFNPAYKKFAGVIETAHLAGINGAIGLTGRDFDSIVMGFLDGQAEPWLENGESWTSDGAKLRITYDIAAKAVDRRGLARANFVSAK